MKACQLFAACSFSHDRSFASLRNPAVITPAAFSGPAGFNAVAIDEAIWLKIKTGCQLSSAAIRITFAAFAGAPANTKISRTASGSRGECRDAHPRHRRRYQPGSCGRHRPVRLADP